MSGVWRPVVRIGAGLVVAIAALLLLPLRVSAHPYLVTEEPPAGTVVSANPSSLTLLFTEQLDGPYCGVDLDAPDGRRLHTAVHVDGSLLTASLPPHLASGTYVARWIVVGRDGHRVAGDFALSIGRASSNPALHDLGAVPVSGGGAAAGNSIEVVVRILSAVLAVPLVGLCFLGNAATARLRGALWVAALACSALLAVVLLLDGGAPALVASVSGRLALLRVLLLAALAPAIGEGGLRRYGWAVGTLLLAGVAMSGHTLAAQDVPLALVVLSVHLVAAALWSAALLRVVVALRGGDGAGDWRAEVRRLTPAAVAGLVLVGATGVYNATANLRSTGDLTGTTYGMVVAAKALLLLGIAGGGTAVLLRRTRRATVRRRWFGVEASLGAAALLLAAALAELPNPVSLPLASQRDPQPAGSAFVTAGNGRHLLPLAVVPGVPGANRLIASVQTTDANDLPVDVSGVQSIAVVGRCACSAGPLITTLHRSGDSSWLAADATLAAGTWSFSLTPRVDGVIEAPGTATAAIDPYPAQGNVLVGVAADLSGADAQACQDRIVGTQAAAVELNRGGVLGGDAVRVVAVDTHETGGAAAVARLQDLHVALLAAPCGDRAMVDAVVAAAAKQHLPLVGGTESGGGLAWSTGPSPSGEGRAIAAEAQALGATDVLVIAGGDAAQRVEAEAVSTDLDRAGLPHSIEVLAIDPARQAEEIRARRPDSIALVTDPGHGLPLLRALGALTPAWSPLHGTLAASSLMSNTLVSSAGDWATSGRILFASEVDPDDAPSLDYAARLQQWYGGRRPSLDGVRGYVCGWVIGNLLRDAGSQRSATSLQHQAASRFTDFRFGSSYRLHWDAGGGGAAQVAFYTTVFTNPMVLIGAPPATSHAGIFLRSGAYVRISPERAAN